MCSWRSHIMWLQMRTQNLLHIFVLITLCVNSSHSVHMCTATISYGAFWSFTNTMSRKKWTAVVVLATHLVENDEEKRKDMKVIRKRRVWRKNWVRLREYLYSPELAFHSTGRTSTAAISPFVSSSFHSCCIFLLPAVDFRARGFSEDVHMYLITNSELSPNPSFQI